MKGFSTVVQEGKRYQPCYALFKDGEEVFRGGTQENCIRYLNIMLSSDPVVELYDPRCSWQDIQRSEGYAIKKLTP